MQKLIVVFLWGTAVGLVPLLGLPPIVAVAQEAPASPAVDQKQDQQKQAQQKLAQVGKAVITRGQVIRVLDQATKNLLNPPAPGDHSPAAIEQGLNQCVDREVILQLMEAKDFAADKSEIRIQLEVLKDGLETRGRKLEDWLQQNGISKSELEREFKWKLSWKKLAAKIDEAWLQKAFAANKEKYDGTTRQVAQILWKSADEQTASKATEVHNQLRSGKVSWKDAVAKHSQASSAKNGGELGWIGFAGPMPRGFTDASWQLSKGEFSEPFTSRFGTHVVWCQDIRPGKKTFDDVVGQLRVDETRELFRSTASKYRDKLAVTLFPVNNASPPRE